MVECPFLVVLTGTSRVSLPWPLQRCDVEYLLGDVAGDLNPDEGDSLARIRALVEAASPSRLQEKHLRGLDRT